MVPRKTFIYWMSNAKRFKERSATKSVKKNIILHNLNPSKMENIGIYVFSIYIKSPRCSRLTNNVNLRTRYARLKWDIDLNMKNGKNTALNQNLEFGGPLNTLKRAKNEISRATTDFNVQEYRDIT